MEYGDYIDLVAQAAKTDDPIKRIEVCCCCLSSVFLFCFLAFVFHVFTPLYVLVLFVFTSFIWKQFHFCDLAMQKFLSLAHGRRRVCIAYIEFWL